MIEGCEHGPKFKTGDSCPECEKESKKQDELIKGTKERILPSIKELEEILEREGSAKIKILPNGEIRAEE